MDAQRHRARAVFRCDAAESADSSARLLLDIASESISPLISGHFATRNVQPDDRALFANSWLMQDSQPSWLYDRWLELAPTLGSPQLLARIVPMLDARHEETRQRAVNALAAITGWDVRRDAAGKLRALASVVLDYKRECVLKP